MRNRYPGTCQCGERVAIGAGEAYRNSEGKWTVKHWSCSNAPSDPGRIVFRGTLYSKYAIAGREFETQYLSHGALKLGDRVSTADGPGRLVSVTSRSLTVLLDTGAVRLGNPGDISRALQARRGGYGG